ncbi:MAG: preprotein translocase subunit SecA [Candidatus Theseobacter exili]|nr:preprotein translocase subunit SecA [Candidatus Theseobacter exili]
MLGWFLKKTIGSKNERTVLNLRRIVEEVNKIEETYQTLSDEQIRAKTDEFKKRIAEGSNLDDILPEAFAAVKNVCRRLMGKQYMVAGHLVTWEMLPFDVQIIGGIVLHQGKIAEMATGEGKTLVATMPLYLNALSGKGVHLVTVNDYLACRDCEWMGEVFKFLGLTVGALQNQMRHEERREVYACDVVYGTNSEFGFDYLRDNSFCHSIDEQVQKGHNYAIIDEVDSILIDESRTPLIISGPSDSTSHHKYDRVKPIVKDLYQKQTYLCNRILKDAKDMIDSLPEKDREEQEWNIGVKLYQVSRGVPKNRPLHKMLEEPAIRKIYEKAELLLPTDPYKKERFEIHEELLFNIDERSREVDLTDKGRNTISPDNPEEFILPNMIESFQEIDEDDSLSEEEKEKNKDRLQNDYNEKSERIHNINQLLRAYCLFEKDVEYVIQENKVMIVDEFTGRLMAGRRFSDGLHQALEAKEGVTIEQETQTYATITTQNYFRMYERLAGMTGTAETEALEFFQIYKLDVVVIPTNDKVRRPDYNDVIYKTRREKFNAIIDEIEKWHEQKRPVLVGTISVDSSEVLSRLLTRRGIKHSVLNARYHQQEAEIVSNAGQPGAVTIATNMAGRGTDIKLHPSVVKSRNCAFISPRKEENPCVHLKEFGCNKRIPCGLHVIGTERHESRRIDRQLRGRSGRQGDPGSSRFYISLEDDLMRLFGSDRIANIMDRLGLEEGQELAHPLLTKSIETAQKRVEQRNYGIRKHLLEYDDVMNKQREVVYRLRNDALRNDNLKEEILEMIERVIQGKLDVFVPEKGNPEEKNIEGFLKWADTAFPIGFFRRFDSFSKMDRDQLSLNVFSEVKKLYEIKETYETSEAMRALERIVILHNIDRLWKEHLTTLDDLREGIGLRAYAQRDPLLEFKSESYAMFEEMIGNVESGVAGDIFALTSSPKFMEDLIKNQTSNTVHNQVQGFAGIQAAAGQPDAAPGQQKQIKNSQSRPDRKTPFQREGEKVGRNDPCPCGSGKKFKKCCGQ